MTTVASTVPRTAISPYARRIARERNVPIDQISGSGPNARIVASDVLSFEAPSNATEFEPTSPDISVPRLTAFSASIPLGPSIQLVADAQAAGMTIDFEDIALRAVSEALRDMPATVLADGSNIALELDDRQLLLEISNGLSVGRQRAKRFEALASSIDDVNKKAALTLSIIEGHDVAPVQMPILSGRKMRLRIMIAKRSQTANVLLCCNSDDIPDDLAIDFLDNFGKALQQPLVLLA